MSKEYWDNHELVREYGRNGDWRLVEILDTQWHEDYFKGEPFAVRNCCGENWATFATLREAEYCLSVIGELYEKGK